MEISRCGICQISVFMFSIDAENSHVDLSLLPEDTGEADILPESLGLPLRLRGKEKEEHDKKNAARKRKMSESKQVCVYLRAFKFIYIYI